MNDPKPSTPYADLDGMGRGCQDCARLRAKVLALVPRCCRPGCGTLATWTFLGAPYCAHHRGASDMSDKFERNHLAMTLLEIAEEQ